LAAIAFVHRLTSGVPTEQILYADQHQVVLPVPERNENMKKSHLSVVLAVACVGLARGQTICGNEKVTTAPSYGLPIYSEVDVSANGRVVAFSSTSDSLAFGDANGVRDVFVFDRDTHVIERVSSAPAGADSNGESRQPAISSDGRFVVFASDASNLVAGDTENRTDIFLRDRVAGTTQRVSQDVHGVGGNGISKDPDITPDGTFIVFSSVANNLGGTTAWSYDIFLFNRLTNTLQQLTSGVGGTEANGDSFHPSVSADGARVAFQSDATNLGPNGGNFYGGAYVWDRASGTFLFASTGVGGAIANNYSIAPTLSADGRIVAFWSYATNLAAGDTGSVPDVFAHDLTTGVTELVSANLSGAAGNADSVAPSVSSNGRFVAFESWANDIAPGLPAPGHHQRIFVRDRWLAQTSLWSVNVDGSAPMQDSYQCAISADGGVVAFVTRANNLTAPPDPDLLLDVFLRECAFDLPTTYCLAGQNSLGCTPAIGSSGAPSASSSSPFDVFASSVLNQRAGLLFYGTHGPQLAPFLGGYLCVRAPTVRSLLQISDGSFTGTDCTGTFHFDFNAHVQSGVDPALTAGTDVWAQYWSRDAAAPSTTNLTDAIAFRVGS
jgi:Tol biopolymer transport system component